MVCEAGEMGIMGEVWRRRVVPVAVWQRGFSAKWA